LDKHLEGERPASRFYDVEREENPRTPRPASLQEIGTTSGGRAAREPVLRPRTRRKTADAEAGVLQEI